MPVSEIEINTHVQIKSYQKTQIPGRNQTQKDLKARPGGPGV